MRVRVSGVGPPPPPSGAELVQGVPGAAVHTHGSGSGTPSSTTPGRALPQRSALPRARHKTHSTTGVKGRALCLFSVEPVGANAAVQWPQTACLCGGVPGPLHSCEGLGRAHGSPAGEGADAAALQKPPSPPACDIPSGRCSFTGPWTVTRSALRVLRRGAAFCQPLRPVFFVVSLPRSQGPVVGALGVVLVGAGFV